MTKNKLLTWAMLFLLIFLTFQIFFNKENKPVSEAQAAPIGLELTKSEYVSGEEVGVKIKNNTENPIVIPANCPLNPLSVQKWTGEKYENISKESPVDCSNYSDTTIQSGEEQTITFRYWNHALFSEPGRYRIEVLTQDGEQTMTSPEFAVVEAGFFRKLFRTVFYQPIYNLLVFTISFAPLKDLGFAIIILTLIIRVILLVPSQRAIVSQRRMQELQPKLEEVKKQHAGNQERIAQETMKLWKQHKVNPFGSCLPMLIQFPVLIALYYVISTGLNPDNAYMVYAPLRGVDLSNLHTNFLGILDLTRVNAIVLPVIIGALQFIQMKLTMAKKKKPGEQAGKSSEMETASKTMVYIMPVMIALFTASVPAGVGLYWGVSTLFGIGQQLVANRKAKIS